MQGRFAKMHGARRFIPAKRPQISILWMGLSLLEEQGSDHSIAGKVDLECGIQECIQKISVCAPQFGFELDNKISPPLAGDTHAN